MFLFNNFAFLFMAVLGLHCCADFSLVAVCGLLTAERTTSLVVEHGAHRLHQLRPAGSIVEASRP